MQKRTNTARVVLRSTLEETEFCRKMQKNGWVLKQSEKGLGFFLRMEFRLFFEHWVELQDNEESTLLTTALSYEELHSCPRRYRISLFRQHFTELSRQKELMKKDGWRPIGRSYKKYYDKGHVFCCTLHQVMARPKV